ncbi:helix-turn-helix domain-containing protein [Streptomyces wuyuanensis]|uniref:helix-turn-helix domain-containing protein n=1 Tax=Streptomyces wuyuanensis TaxID=1196353 RepID=UPI0034430AC2
MLRQARLRAGLGFRQAARLAGISHSHLNWLETGRRCPSASTAEQLATALRLTAEEREALSAASVRGAGRDRRTRSKQ